MENNKEVTTTETVENNANTEVKEEVKAETKTEKTYTRAEVEQIKKAEREILLKEMEAKRTEAEKLAKMDAEEKLKYERDKIIEERDNALSKLNAYELEKEAVKIASGKELPISLLSVIDYTKENAESIKTKIDEIEVVYKQAIQNGINDRMKEKTPKTVVDTTTKQNVSRASY
jgi:membrane-associated HD superfamily phosphohydrolase